MDESKWTGTGYCNNSDIACDLVCERCTFNVPKSNDTIIAYVMRDRRSKHGIRVSNGKPRYVLKPSEFKRVKNKKDWIPFTKGTIHLRNETQLFRSWGFKC